MRNLAVFSGFLALGLGLYLSGYSRGWNVGHSSAVAQFERLSAEAADLLTECGVRLLSQPQPARGGRVTR